MLLHHARCITHSLDSKTFKMQHPESNAPQPHETNAWLLDQARHRKEVTEVPRVAQNGPNGVSEAIGCLSHNFPTTHKNMLCLVQRMRCGSVKMTSKFSMHQEGIGTQYGPKPFTHGTYTRSEPSSVHRFVQLWVSHNWNYATSLDTATLHAWHCERRSGE